MFISKERRVSARAGTGIQYIPGHIEPFTDLILADFLPKNGNILDLAGGGLRFAIPVAQKGLDITVVDADGGSLDFDVIAERVESNRGRALQREGLRPRIRPVLGDVFDFLEQAQEVFSLITCFRFIHFLPPERFELFFSRAAKRLSPGGVLAFSSMTPRDLERGGKNEMFLRSTAVSSASQLFREFDSSQEAAEIQRAQNLGRRFHLIDESLAESLATRSGLELVIRDFKATRVVAGYVARKLG